MGHTLETMRLACDNRLAWSTISNEDFTRTGARDEDTEGFVNEMLFIKPVQIAFLLREPKPGKVHGSIRSRGDYDVAEVARTSEAAATRTPPAACSNCRWKKWKSASCGG